MLLVIVTLMSVAANLPNGLSELSGVDRRYLLAGLLIVVTIALVRYSKFALVAAIFILAVGANLPQDIAAILNIDSRILMGSLIAIVLLSLANRVIKLPTGLDKPQGFSAEHGSAALFGAIARRRTRTVRSIINSGANIEARSEGGLTPLMVAAAKGYDELVLLLVIKGADIKAVDGRGKNASQFARDAGYEHTVSLILKGGVRGADKGNNFTGAAPVEVPT